jgi:hypothetical protein
MVFTSLRWAGSREVFTNLNDFSSEFSPGLVGVRFIPDESRWNLDEDTEAL